MRASARVWGGRGSEMGGGAVLEVGGGGGRWGSDEPAVESIYIHLCWQLTPTGGLNCVLFTHMHCLSGL